MKYQKDNRKYQKDNCCGTSKTMFLYSTSFKNTCAAIPLWKTHFALLKQSTSAFWKLRGPRKTYSGASKRPTKRFKRASKHSQYVTIVCVGMILFQNAFFNDVSSENTVFAVPRKVQKAFLRRQIWLQEGVKTLQSTVDNLKMSHMCIFVVHCQK